MIFLFLTFSKDKSPASIALKGYKATTIFWRGDVSWKEKYKCNILDLIDGNSKIIMYVEKGWVSKIGY